MDFSGTVESVGDGVEGFKVGDEVSVVIQVTGTDVAGIGIRGGNLLVSIHADVVHSSFCPCPSYNPVYHL